MGPEFDTLSLSGEPTEAFRCRPGCAACCIAPSITSPIPGMPSGKPAGVKCIQLDEEGRCLLFGSEERPNVCAALSPSREMCGSDSETAMEYLKNLEEETRPE
jgi:Fe-S-cluster containining protein